ncbi:MAG: YbaN family protein [Pseudomonadota bacterium]
MILTAPMVLLRILGGLFLLLGGIGLVLPVWPTTIFWILAAVCFARSSPRGQAWIYRQPVLGQTIENFVEYGTMDRRSKRAASIGMLIFGGPSLWFARHQVWIAALIAGLLIIGLVYIWSRPVTKTPE